MSSHHVIREKQEPSVLVYELNDNNLSQLEQILEWSPILMVWFTEIGKVLSHGLKVDVIFCRKENRFEDMLEEHHPLKLVATTSPTLADAIAYAKKDQHEALNIICEDVEDTLHHISYDQDFKITLIDGEHHALPFEGNFEKWKVKGESVKIFGEVRSTANLKLVDNNLFEVIEDGSVKVEGKGWVVE